MGSHAPSESDHSPERKKETDPDQDQDNSGEHGSGPSSSHSPIPSNEGEGSPQNLEELRGWKLWRMLIPLTIVCFLIALNASIVATAIPRITEYFESIADVGWYGTAYLLPNCALLPLAGKLYVYYSSKWTFLTHVVFFELGALVCAVAKSSNIFILGRAISGAGAAGVFNGSITILTTIAPLDERPVLVGWIMAMAGIGSVVGPLIGGAITEEISWRWCFYINLPCGGFAALWLALLRVPDRTHQVERLSGFKMIFRKLDFIGFSIFSGSVVMLLLAVEWGGVDYDWESATIIGLFCGSFVTMCLYYPWARFRGEDALVPLDMFRHRVVRCACLTGFMVMGSLMLLTYYLPIWFQAIKDASPMMSGVMNLPTMVSQIVATIVSGVVVGRFGYHTPWAIAGSGFSAIGGGLMTIFTVSSGADEWIGYQILVGVGRGMVLQMCVIAVQAVLPDEEIDLGSSFVIFCQFFGGAVCVALCQTIFQNRLGPALEQYAPQIPAQKIINLGATGIRKAIQQPLLDGVIKAYNKALTQSYLLAAGTSAVATISSIGLGWKSLKRVTAETSKA